MTTLLTLLTREDARTILEMADLCFTEGSDIEMTSLLQTVKDQYPDLAEDYDYIPCLQD